MPLAESVPTPVIIGTWVGVITVTLLLIGTIVRVSFSWSRLVGQMEYIVKRFDEHLGAEKSDRDERAENIEMRFTQMDARIRRVEKAIDDIRARMRNG